MTKVVRISLIKERKLRQWSQQEVANRLGTTRVNISRWEQGQTTPGPYFRTRLSALFGKQPEELGLQVDLEGEKKQSTSDQRLPLWYVPHQRNAFFTGREDELHQLHTALRRESSGMLSQSCLLSGLGGIGKTQTALEYVYRYANDYTAIFWMNAETSEQLLASFLDIADLLDPSEKDEQGQRQAMVKVTRWLSNSSGWLLIFDNVEDIELIKDILPFALRGSLLITSRRSMFGLTAHTLGLQRLSLEEGIYFLLRRIGRFARLPDLDALSQEDAASLREIVTVMDGLPLALDQAGSYIEATQCSLSDYLQLFTFSKIRLLDERETYTHHPLSVTRTFVLAFEQLEQSDPFAAQLLTACAHLSPEAIPEQFFLDGAVHLGEPFATFAADPLQFNAVIKALLTRSLLQRDASAHTLTIHRLVQVVLKERLSEETQRSWSSRLLFTMSQLFPFPKTLTDYYQVCKRLLPHALACLTLGERWGEDKMLRVILMSHVAFYLVCCASFSEAEPLYTRALQLAELVVTPEHPLMAELFCGLANLFWEQGKYEQAELLFQKALQILQGREYRQMATILNSLGIIYAQQEKYEQAERYFQQALQIWEQSTEPTNPQFCIALANLANLFWEQEKYTQAEPLFQRVLQIWEQTLGPEHPQVAHPLQGLAELYTKQGKYEQAEPLFQRVLRIREYTLGPEHPRVAHPLQGLAELYTKQGKYEQAESLFQHALRIRERGLRSDHPEVAETLHSLAQFYQLQQRTTEALALYQRALAIREQALGVAHPKTCSTRLACTSLLQEARSDFSV